jgi:hypothetical protein
MKTDIHLIQVVIVTNDFLFFGKELNYDDDSQLLKLVEAYCSLTARSRQTVKSGKQFPMLKFG